MPDPGRFAGKGVIVTGAARGIGAAVAARFVAEGTPMERLGTPGDIAGPVAFLASPDAAFVTGVVMPVDGGFLAARHGKI